MAVFPDGSRLLLEAQLGESKSVHEPKPCPPYDTMPRWLAAVYMEEDVRLLRYLFDILNEYREAFKEYWRLKAIDAECEFRRNGWLP